MPTSQEAIADALEKQDIQTRLKELEGQMRDIRGDRDKALKSGIVALGTAVISMAVWIFNLITSGHLK